MIAAERFVAAVAGQRADDAPVAHGARDPVRGDEAGVRERLVEVPQQVQDRFGREGPLAQVDRVVLRAVVRRDSQRRRRFVMGAVRKPDVEGRRALARGTAVRRDDERRVDPAGQERRDGHVRHRLGLHGAQQRARRRLDGLRHGARAIGAGLDALVLAQALSRGPDREGARSRERLDVCEPGGGLRDVAEAEKVVAGLAVDLGPEAREREDRLHLAREHPLAGVTRIVQRLHPEPVPGQEETALPPVVDGEREDPPQQGDHLLAGFLVQVDEDLGVRGAAEAVAAALQLGGELPVVVDLAIVDDPDAPILVAHRLVAGGRQVDERQAAVHELAPLVRPMALAVRAPMGEQRGRPSGPTRVGGQAVGVKTPG